MRQYNPNLGIQISEGFLPRNLATAANDGDWVNLCKFQRLLVVLFKGVGTAGEDPTLTLEQATDAAGSGAKALNFTEIFVKQAGTDLQSTTGFTKITQSAANTYTELTAAESAAIWVVQVTASMLDRAGGFCWVRGRVADVGSASQLGGLLYISDGLRRTDGGAMPSVID